ncbi:phosphatase PAP2 family protein [Agromyces atrinae]|uniref:Membrane-associated phospholipid phosphatase n=1 Tax=Agromyces atrinae TaxID=592376 RepID=A0A4Q2MCZ6_9MICO|nr:phosphatase PAP2 family protein [Agromyces atrinae]NYD67195.1 membrane-associated phospholipid phosphatase [Agromyces atrinae]RXZ86970.1 phosphatase PAP2 family protein [Agromyces atrinae]
MTNVLAQPVTALLGRARRRWIVLAVAALLALAAIYVAAVLTPLGQQLENAALRGADQQAAETFREASERLGLITVWSLAAATLAVGAIGLLRRKPLLAAVAVGVIVVGQIVTQTLKRFVLPRPELVEVVGDYTGNSFPSGHTTIAMTVLVAVILVVPFRFRGLALLVVMTWATSIGAYTIAAKWHRLSDTLGADMVALGLGCVAALVLVRTGRVVIVDEKRRLRVVYVVLIGGLGLLTLGLGLVLGWSAFAFDITDPTIEWNAYLAAAALASAGSIGTALVYWWSWRRLEAA